MKEFPERIILRVSKCPKCGARVDDTEYDPSVRILFAICSMKDYRKEILWA